MLLSVLSALARRNVDPWDEAARLARLPRDAATGFLTTLIAALPEGASARTDPGALAERLIALLPPRSATDRASADRRPVVEFATDRRAFTRYVILYLVLMLLFLGAQWLEGHSQPAPHTPLPMAAPASGLPHN
jgi:hypothetical protein